MEERQAVNELKREFNVERWKEEVYSTENVNYRLQFEKNLLLTRIFVLQRSSQGSNLLPIKVDRTPFINF